MLSPCRSIKEPPRGLNYYTVPELLDEGNDNDPITLLFINRKSFNGEYETYHSVFDPNMNAPLESLTDMP